MESHVIVDIAVEEGSHDQPMIADVWVRLGGERLTIDEANDTYTQLGHAITQAERAHALFVGDGGE